MPDCIYALGINVIFGDGIIQKLGEIRNFIQTTVTGTIPCGKRIITDCALLRIGTGKHDDESAFLGYAIPVTGLLKIRGIAGKTVDRQYQGVFFLLIGPIIAGHIYIPKPLITVYVFPDAAHADIFRQAGATQVAIAIAAPAGDALKKRNGLHTNCLNILHSDSFGRSVPELANGLLIDKVLPAIGLLQVNMGKGVG